MAVSAQLGMGAIPYVGGVGFRVWAKFATAVNVAGTFDNWSDTATPLTLEANGYWSTDVPGAAVGDEYKCVITIRDGRAVEKGSLCAGDGCDEKR